MTKSNSDNLTVCKTITVPRDLLLSLIEHARGRVGMELQKGIYRQSNKAIEEIEIDIIAAKELI